MRKIILFSFICLFGLGCKQKEASQEKAEPVDTFFDATSLPKLVDVRSEATVLLNDWTVFMDLQRIVDRLYTVVNDEDLTLVLAELEAQIKVLNATPFPEAFDDPSVKSRINVFKTFVLQTQAKLTYAMPTMDDGKTMVHAFNAIKEQCSILVSNTFNEKLLINEDI